jgi:hypothetical protein
MWKRLASSSCSCSLARLFSALCWAMSMLLPAQGTASQNNAQADIALSLAVQPQVVKRGQEALLQLRLRNPRQNETVTLRATATYTDEAGVQRQATSNEVQLVIDASLPVRIEIPADRVRLVPGSALFDGVPITATVNTAISVDVVLPGDGQDHLLQLRVIR